MTGHPLGVLGTLTAPAHAGAEMVDEMGYSLGIVDVITTPGHLRACELAQVMVLPPGMLGTMTASESLWTLVLVKVMVLPPGVQDALKAPDPGQARELVQVRFFFKRGEVQ